MADAGAGRARNIVFRITWPETEEGLPLLDPSLWPDCKYCVYQLEQGDETHRLHYQGYMEFTGAKRFTWLHANCDGLESANFFIRRGSQDEAVNYAMKRETRVEGPWEWGLARPNEAGKRNDLVHVKRALDEGRSMAYIADNFFGPFLRYQRGFKEYKRLKMPKRDWPMEIIVIIGPTGTNKTRWCRENYPDAYWKDGTKWWDDYDGHETVVWDEFYAQDDASLPNTNAPNLRLFRNDNVTPTDYAVVFDGSSGYGNLPDYASLDTAAADLSIRMYIKPNKIKQQTLVHRAGQFRVHMNAIGKITFEGPGGLSITSAASVTPVGKFVVPFPPL